MSSTPHNASRVAGGRPRSVGLVIGAVVVLVASIATTVVAAKLLSDRSNEQAEAAFRNEADATVERVADRLERYEVGLWAGVGLIEALGSEQTLRRSDWLHFAENLDLIGKYPGINGIGVIFEVDDEDISRYVESFSQDYPEIDNFGITPAVDAATHFPITFIEPFVGNEQAVGLDMAFEENRLAGTEAALRTGRSQVTAPIVLVQDDEQTPGFLFFAPFGDSTGGLGESGLVYAPFIAQRLMEGTLNATRREVGVEIADGDSVLYSEFTSPGSDRGEAPRFRTVENVELYGRTWAFTIHSNESYRSFGASREPMIVLIAGALVNVLILGLFVNHGRAQRRTEHYADAVTVELRDALAKLEDSNSTLHATNHDLEQFVYIASHDLQTPIRTVSNYATLLHEDLHDDMSDEHRRAVDALLASTERMHLMIRSVLDYSTASRSQDSVAVDLADVVDEVLREFDETIGELGGHVHVEPLPVVAGSADALSIVFRNLIGNALKYHRDGVAPEVALSAYNIGREFRIEVADNGIGIESEFRSEVFDLFVRLNPANKYDGAGFGLSMCKRIVENHGGKITIDNNPAGGTTVAVTLPSHPAPNINH